MWARVEGKRHYLTDSLTGYSIGYFVSGFLYDSLMNLEDHETLVFSPFNDKMTLTYQVRF